MRIESCLLLELPFSEILVLYSASNLMILYQDLCSYRARFTSALCAAFCSLIFLIILFHSIPSIVYFAVHRESLKHSHKQEEPEVVQCAHDREKNAIEVQKRKELLHILVCLEVWNCEYPDDNVN